jgi:hypothetical protein
MTQGSSAVRPSNGLYLYLISVGFLVNCVSVGMVQGHVYFCRYCSRTRVFLSVFFADICIFDSIDPCMLVGVFPDTFISVGIVYGHLFFYQ